MSVEQDVHEPAGAEGDRRLAREVAQRVFAAEFGPSTLEFKEGGERSPSYVVTPLGARVNRLLVVGVLTSKENVGQGGDMWRAQIHDPTGTFNVYAGQYQPEAAAALAEIKPPAVVAVVGKSRTYSPEGGVVYTSIRPESIRVVDVSERDRWIVETAKHTLHRIAAVREAKRAGGAPSAKTLEEVGYAPDLADGVVRALAHYQEGDEVRRIATAVKDALESVLPGAANAMAAGFAPATAYAPAPAHAPAPPPQAPAPSAAVKPTKVVDPAEEARKAEVEEQIHGLTESLDDGKGAPWEDIVAEAAKRKVTEAEVEEALNNLMDKGLIYEPVLGRLKRT